MINKKGKLNPMYGKKHSKHSKEKMSEFAKTRTGTISANWKGGARSHYDYHKNYSRKLREATLAILGNKCSRCGFDDIRALQIDHINGGGSIERKHRSFKGLFHNNVIKSVLNKENKYQLLCANCNWIKRFEKKEVRKKTRI